jgi:hypothetical protein
MINPRKLLLLSSDRFDAAKIIANCLERIMVIGFVTILIANSIHNSKSSRGLELEHQDRLEQQ